MQQEQLPPDVYPPVAAIPLAVIKFRRCLVGMCDLLAAYLRCHQLPVPMRAFVDVVALSLPQQAVPDNRRVARA